jgi:hypothetical protein
MPMVADCAAVRQRRETSVTGWGSLTENEKLGTRVLGELSSLSTRRCPALMLLCSMALITGQVPFGCEEAANGSVSS